WPRRRGGGSRGSCWRSPPTTGRPSGSTPGTASGRSGCGRTTTRQRESTRWGWCVTSRGSAGGGRGGGGPPGSGDRRGGGGGWMGGCRLSGLGVCGGREPPLRGVPRPQVRVGRAGDDEDRARGAAPALFSARLAVVALAGRWCWGIDRQRGLGAVVMVRD